MHEPPSHRILLAEEQAISRDLVMLVLGKLGYRIDSATCARDLLQRAGSGQLSLILLSTSLEDRAGAALLHEIQAGPANGALPVAMIGPQTDELSSDAWLEAGAIAYLTRPIDIERLLHVVERAVRPAPPPPPAEPGAEPVLDLAHLRSFTDGDPQLESELLALFLSTAEVYLQRMSEDLRTGQTWASSVHALKGSSANLGARRVMILAIAAERAPPTSVQLEALRQAVDELRAFGNPPSR